LPRQYELFWTLKRQSDRMATSCEHVVSAIDCRGTLAGAYMVMPYLKGEQLDEIQAREGALELSRAIRLVTQLLSGLSAIHASGVVHYDIRPHHLRVTPRASGRGREKLTIIDFSLARSLDGESESFDRTVSAPEFVAPERITHPARVDPASDVYAAGVTLYRLLTARFPFQDGTGPSSLKKALPACPTSLDSLYLSMLERNPRSRPTAREALKAVRSLRLS
jgi:serine/threonine-protein kinase